MTARLAACVILCAHTALAQPDPGTYVNPLDFSSEALYATGTVLNGARATGLGGAYTAVAEDLAAIAYNPAGLAQIRRIEFGIGMRHHRDEATFSMFDASATESNNSTGLDAVGFAYPVPTYRGSLVFALAVDRARSNELESVRVDQRSDVDYQLDDRFLRRQEGSLWRLAGAVGVDILPQLSIGAGMAYWRGTLRDDQLREFDEVLLGGPLRAVDRLRTEATVNGFGFDLGLLGHLTNRMRVGLRFASPVWLDISGDGELSLDDPTDATPPSQQLLYIDQNPRLPWSMTGAVSWASGPLLVAGDATYTAWDELDLDDLDGAETPLAVSDYRSAVSARAGAELTIPLLPMRVRAGYAYDPVVYELLLGNPARVSVDRNVLSAGAGVLLADTFTLDVGVSYATFQRADEMFDAVFEDRTEKRVVLTAAYRY